MSLESWLKEFYPVDASDVTEEDAVGHSLKKWRGLTKENLDRYGLRQSGNAIGREGDWMEIDSDSCALCHHHIDNVRRQSCRECPLKVHLGHRCDADDMPYLTWVFDNDAQPMIDALEKIL